MADLARDPRLPVGHVDVLWLAGLAGMAAADTGCVLLLTATRCVLDEGWQYGLAGGAHQLAYSS